MTFIPISSADREAMPRFAFQEEPRSALHGRVLGKLAALLAWGMAALALAAWALRHPRLG